MGTAHLTPRQRGTGGSSGIEAAFRWSVAGTRGRLMRAYGFGRGQHVVAFILFAKRASADASDFAWVRRTIVWLRQPRREDPRRRGAGWYPQGY